MKRKYKVVYKSGDLSGGICNPAYFTEEETFDSFEEAFAFFNEKKAWAEVAARDDRAFFNTKNSIVFFASRGYGISDCSEYRRVTLSW